MVHGEAECLHSELAVGGAGVVEVGVEVKVEAEEYDWGRGIDCIVLTNYPDLHISLQEVAQTSRWGHIDQGYGILATF